MNSIFEQLLSSSSTYAIAKNLITSGHPLSLRELADRSQLAVRSIQVATQKLTNANIIAKRKLGNRVFFSFHPEADFIPALVDLFAADRELEIGRQAKRWCDRSHDLLNRLQDLNDSLVVLRNLNR